MLQFLCSQPLQGCVPDSTCRPHITCSADPSPAFNPGMIQWTAGNAKALATVTAIIDGMGSCGAAVGPLLTGHLVSMSGQFDNVSGVHCSHVPCTVARAADRWYTSSLDEP